MASVTSSIWKPFAFFLTLFVCSIGAFTPSFLSSPTRSYDAVIYSQQNTNTYQNRQSVILCAEEEPQEKEKVAVIDKSPVQEGSHEELMYALGVNLARQLGDIRPLVENGEELANVAKGLLDVVVGRFTEEGQVDLLKRRGKELTATIASRAYVS